MSNSLEYKLEEAKHQLKTRRGTGRTNKMIKKVLQRAMTSGEAGDYFVILGHTPEWAKDMKNRAMGFLNEVGIKYQLRPGAIEIKAGVLILFNTNIWWERNQEMIERNVKEVNWDNVFGDRSMEDYIKYLENELNPVEPFRSEMTKRALEKVKKTLQWETIKNGK